MDEQTILIEQEEQLDNTHDVSAKDIALRVVSGVALAVGLVGGLFFYQVKAPVKITPQPREIYISGRPAEGQLTSAYYINSSEVLPLENAAQVLDGAEILAKSDYELGQLELPDTKNVWGYECPVTYKISDFNSTVAYSSSNADVATVDENGNITVVGNGQTQINIISGDITVPVDFKAYRYVQPDAMPENISVFTSENKEYITLKEYELLDSSFTIEDGAIAEVTPEGHIVGLKQGKTNISCTLSNGETGTTRVTVYQAVSEIQLSAVSCRIGGTAKVSIKLLPADCNYGTAVTYEIADTSIATVDANGNVRGIKKGTTTITATSENGIKSSALVTVNTVTPRDLAQGKQPTTSTSGNYDTSNPAVKAAMGYVGKKRTSNEVAAAAAKALGITDSNFIGKGSQVSPDSMQAGDIVYWENGGDGNIHLAVYIGDGMAVHGDWSGGICKIASAFYKEPTAVIRLK